MASQSFRAIIRKRDPGAPGTFKVDNGPLWGGEEGRFGLSPEGLTQEDYDRLFAGQDCLIEVCEVRGRARGSRSWQREHTLAVFQARVIRKGSKEFYFSDIRRTDLPSDRPYANHLPAKKDLTEKWAHYYRECWLAARPESGKWRSVDVAFFRHLPGWMPNWKPPHFILDFLVDRHLFDKPTTIVVPENTRREAMGRGRRVRRFYSVGFTVQVPGGTTFLSAVTSLDCHNLLSHNCRVATEGIYLAHREMRRQRSARSLPPVGTHWGSEHYRVLGSAEQLKLVRTDARQYQLAQISCVTYPLQVGWLGFAHTFAVPRPRSPGKCLPLERQEWLPSLRLMWKSKTGTLGPILQELIDQGWLAIYFNPDTAQSAFLDVASRPYHTRVAEIVATSGRYVGSGSSLRVHDTVTDYFLRNRRSAETPADKRKLRKLNHVSFGFLVTGAGHIRRVKGQDRLINDTSHCGLLVKGRVYEVHWDRSAADDVLFDNKPLADLTASPPKLWGWGSGLVVVPRGEWP